MQTQKGTVHNLRPFIPMRFRLTQQKAKTLREGGIVNKIQQINPLSIHPIRPSPLQLKFCKQISPHHYIFGNQYQLNLLNLSRIYPDSVDIASQWTLSFSEKITRLQVMSRLHKIFVICHNFLYCYGYRPDSIQTPPIFYQKMTLKHAIEAIYVPKRDILLVFNQSLMTVFEMYNPKGLFKFKQLFSKEYRSEHKHSFVCIPQQNQATFSLFFQNIGIIQEQNIQDIQGVGTLREPKVNLEIYHIKIVFNTAKDIIINPIQKMLSIMIPIHFGLKFSIYVSHYKQDIYLMHVGTSVLIFRHNYIIDQLQFPSNKGKRFVFPLSKTTLIYTNNNAYDIYSLELDERFKPQRLIAKCIDFISVKYPIDSTLLKIYQTPERMIFFFQSTVPVNLNEVYFWIGISDCVTKEAKLKLMLPERFQFDLEEGEEQMTKTINENVEIACKIGFSRSQAFLQLWRRCTKASEITNEQENKKKSKEQIMLRQQQQRKEQIRKLTKREYYNLLIATEDYDMIREELEGKLKVHQLRYSQIHFVLKNILEILSQKVITECSRKIIKQYCMCHFFCSKLQMLWNIIQQENKLSQTNLGHALRQETKPSPITVSIQQYYELNNLQIFSELFRLLQLFLVENKPVKIKIRALLSQFSLIFRISYFDILPKIIETHFCHLPQLIKSIPEILPIQISEDNKQGIYKGVWEQFELELTQNFILLERITKFQNKQFIQDFKSSHFFKIYQWNLHATIKQPLETIKESLKKYNPEYFFTQLYSCLYLKREEHLQKGQLNSKNINNINDHIDYIIRHVERYPLIPARLKGKFYFYSNLYKHFKNFKHYEKSNKQPIKVLTFFGLKEEDLFLLYFTKEREQIGIFILKQIKPIYQLASQEGFSIFLRNMENFFKSKQSSWSDIKIILLKFNNEKQSFHEGNQPIFDVIVKSIMQKVYISKDRNENSIELHEVISYVENIPILAEDNELLYNLVAIRQMHLEEPLLKALNLNMSLSQIMSRGEEVIYKMVEHEVKKHKMFQLSDPKQVLLYSYIILVQINQKRGNIYLDKHLSFPYKSLLILLMQQQYFIPKCSKLIEDDYLRTSFKIDTKVFENIMIYLYRQRLTKSPIYCEHKCYLRVLLEYLKLNSNKSKFIILSQAFADIFTMKKFKIQYPFFEGYYPTTIEIHQLVNSLDKDQVQKINYEELYKVTIALKLLGECGENIKANQNTLLSGTLTGQKDVKVKIKHQIYTIFFIKMQREGLFRQALKLAKLIVEINLQQNVSDIILPILLIESLQAQMLPKIYESLLRLISYYYYYQMELLQIIEQLINPKNSFSTQEVEIFILEKIQVKKQTELIYNPQNQFFSQTFRKLLDTMTAEQQIVKINPLMETIWKQISQRKEQFITKSIYCIMFRLLIHDPLTLAEYIYYKHSGINVRSLRALFTLLGFQCIFSMYQILEVGKSIFKILMGKLLKRLGKPQKDFDDSQQYEKYCDEYIDEIPRPTAEDLLGNSISIMNAKCQELFLKPEIEQIWKIPTNINIDEEHQDLEEAKIAQIRHIIEQPELYLQRKTKQSYILLQRLNPHFLKKNSKIYNDPQMNEQSDRYKYPFDDQDLLYSNPKYDLDIPLLCYKPTIIFFDEIAQRTESYNQTQYTKAQTFNCSDRSSNLLSIHSHSNKPSGGESQFEQLFQNVLKQKANKYNKKQTFCANKSRTWLKRDYDEDSGSMVDLLFEKKCRQGGYTSMLKILQSSKSLHKNIHQNPLTGDLDVSEILEDASRICIEQENSSEHSVLGFRQI